MFTLLKDNSCTDIFQVRFDMWMLVALHSDANEWFVPWVNNASSCALTAVEEWTVPVTFACRSYCCSCKAEPAKS